MSAVSSVQELLDDTNTFWPNQSVYDSINEAALELFGDIDVGTVVSTITTVSGQELVNLPSDVMIPQMVVGGSKEIFISSVIDMERFNRAWRTHGRAKPTHFVLWDVEKLRAYPIPDATYAWVIHGQGFPSFEMSGTSTDFTISKPIKKSIVFRAAAILTNAVRPDLTSRWTAEAIDYRDQAARAIRKRGGNIRLKTIKPGDIRSIAHTGNVQIGQRISSGRIFT